MDVKERLLLLIKKGSLNAAYELSREYIRQYQADEQFVILYIMLAIAKEEMESGADNIFSVSDTRSADELITHFQNIKFCVRRFEYELDEQAREDAMEYFKIFNVSLQAIVCIINYACVDLDKVIGEIADHYEKKGDFEKAEILRGSL